MNIPCEKVILLEIVDLLGKNVHGILLNKSNRTDPSILYDWDGRDANGQKAKEGIYFIKVQSDSGVFSSWKLVIK